MKTKPRLSEDKEKSSRVTRTRAATENPPEAELSSETAPKSPATRRIRKTVSAAIAAAVTPIKKGINKAKTTTAKKLEVPSILLEGDRPAPPADSGPGQKFALGVWPVSPRTEKAEPELPEAYGTKKLFLTARDPHWLYANWDLTQEQLLKLNAKSAEGHLILRIYLNK